MFEEYLANSSSKINYLINNKKSMSVSTILSDFEQKLNPMPYKIDQYKQFVEKTEQSMILIEKSITKLTEHFREHKRFLDNETQSNYLNEALLNLSTNSEVFMEDKSSIGAIIEKFTHLSQALTTSTLKYAKNLAELTLNPLEQLNYQISNDSERDSLKKTLNKAFRVYESKKLKHKKSLKDLVYMHNNDISYNYGININKPNELTSRDEKSNLSIHLFEYLSQINKAKTIKLNQLVNCMFNSFKNQVNYVEETYKLLIDFMQQNDDTMTHNLNSLLSSFNTKQSLEKQLLEKKLKSLRTKAIYRTESTPFISSSNSKSGQLLYNKNSTNKTHLFGMTHPFTSHHSSTYPLLESPNIYSLSHTPSSRANSILNDNLTSKSGYLYKRAMHARMGKSWLKRKCSAENGVFLIHHSDEREEPTKLNLALCEIKIFGDKKFQVYYPNEKVFNFMAEKESDFNEWLSVLNKAKKNFYMNNEENTNDNFVQDIIDKILKLKGNQHCCDCGREKPEWLSTNLGVLTCIYCCGIHRDLGVHISKTQSIKIDRLSTLQLIVASMIGNAGFNQIFEENMDPSEKIKPDCSTEQRHRFIRDKYERHKFVKIEQNLEKVLNEFIDYAKENDYKSNFELILYIYGQNFNLLTPFDTSLNRNLLQLCIIYLDEEAYYYLIHFIIQNRDFNKNKYTIDHQDINGNTALHFCAIYNRLDTAKALLKINVNSEILNDNSLTPYELANQYSNYELANVIKLYKEGKQIDPVTWVLPESDGVEKPKPSPVLTEKFDSNMFSSKRVIRARPATLIESQFETSTPNNLYERRRYIRPKSHARVSSLTTPSSFFFELPERYEKVVKNNSSSNSYEDSDNNDEENTKETGLLKCKSIKDYEAPNSAYLSFKQNDLIVIESKYDDNFWYGYVENKPNVKGIFLSNLVNVYI